MRKQSERGKSEICCRCCCEFSGPRWQWWLVEAASVQESVPPRTGAVPWSVSEAVQVARAEPLADNPYRNHTLAAARVCHYLAPASGDGISIEKLAKYASPAMRAGLPSGPRESIRAHPELLARSAQWVVSRAPVSAAPAASPSSSQPASNDQ